MSTKRCYKCRTEKDLSQFSKGQKMCKECYRDYRERNLERILAQKAQYRKENRDSVLEQKRKYREKFKDSIRAKAKQRYKEDPKHFNDLNKASYERHKEKRIKTVRAWMIRNKDARNKWMRGWAEEKRRNDPHFKLAGNLRHRVYSALKSQGVKKSEKTEALIGCSIQALKEHLEKQFQEGMTWDNYGEWHVDHILPCDSFDLSSEEEQKRCFHYTNLQPLWAKENLVKWKNLLVL